MKRINRASHQLKGEERGLTVDKPLEDSLFTRTHRVFRFFQGAQVAFGMSQNATVTEGFGRENRRGACSDAGCREIFAFCDLVALCSSRGKPLLRKWGENRKKKAPGVLNYSDASS